MKERTASDPCTGTAYTVEFHRVAQACPGDVMGLNIVGMDMHNLPRPGDVIVVGSFTARLVVDGRLVKDFTVSTGSDPQGVTWKKSSMFMLHRCWRKRPEP